MVIASPRSNSDNSSNQTLVNGEDQHIVLNSNSLESVPSLLSDMVWKLFIYFFVQERNISILEYL